MTNQLSLQEWCERTTRHMNEQTVLIAEIVTALSVVMCSVRQADPKLAASIGKALSAELTSNTEVKWFRQILIASATGEDRDFPQAGHDAPFPRLEVDNSKAR